MLIPELIAPTEIGCGSVGAIYFLPLGPWYLPKLIPILSQLRGGLASLANSEAVLPAYLLGLAMVGSSWNRRI